MTENEIGKKALEAVIRLHRDMGRGLPEIVSEGGAGTRIFSPASAVSLVV